MVKGSRLKVLGDMDDYEIGLMLELWRTQETTTNNKNR